jgi:hypothetical protein
MSKNVLTYSHRKGKTDKVIMNATYHCGSQVALSIFDRTQAHLAHNEWIFSDRWFISFQEIVDQLQKIKFMSSSSTKKGKSYANINLLSRQVPDTHVTT